MPRTVERHAVRTETCDALVLGLFVEGVPAGVVREHGAQVLDPDVVCPGNRNVGTFDDIFAIGVVEVAVAHGILSLGTACRRRVPLAW